MRLPRKHSIRSHAHFAAVRERGTAKFGKLLILSTLPAPHEPALRTAFVTSRRCGKAHERVLLRRRLRSIVQKHGPLLIDPKRYLITIARPGAAMASFAELEAEWLHLAKRLRLLSKQPPTIIAD